MHTYYVFCTMMYNVHILLYTYHEWYIYINKYICARNSSYLYVTNYMYTNSEEPPKWIKSKLSIPVCYIMLYLYVHEYDMYI